MAFSKICPMCNQDHSSLVTYMAHIKNDHSKESPESFVRKPRELKWRLRNDDLKK